MTPVDHGSSRPVLVGHSEQQVSPWVTLVAREVLAPTAPDPQTFHSLIQADYVCVVAVTETGEIPFVRQYRPALDRVSLELPAGLVDAEEDPALAGSRELVEESGLRPLGALAPLGCFDPDSARLENRLWGYFAAATQRVENWVPEPGVEPLLLRPEQVVTSIAEGTLRHALHIAMLGVCVFRGLLELPNFALCPRLAPRL